MDNAISLEPEKENFIKDRAIANTEMQQQNPDIYIDIQRTKNNVIDNSTTLSNEEKNKLRQIYNEITNGNFSKIAKDLLIKPSDLNPPADPNKFGKGAQSDVGYKTQQNQQSLTNAKTNVEALKQEIVQQTKTNEEPRIIKVEPHKETKSKNLPGNGNQFIKGLNITSLSAAVIPVITGNELKELIDNNAATISDAIKGFQKLTDSARTLVVDTVKRMSVAQQSYVLNKTDNSTKSKIIIEGNLDYEQLNVDLDFNHKKLLEEDVA